MSLLRSRRSDVWYSLLLVGLVAGLAALVAAFGALRLFGVDLRTVSWREVAPRGYGAFVLAVALVAAMLGATLWWLAIIRPDRLSVRRGIGVGAFGGLLAHPLVWYAILVVAFLTGQPTVLGVFQVANPLVDLVAAAVLSVFSLVWAGWLTALLGGLTGGTIAALQSRFGCQERWRAALAPSA